MNDSEFPETASPLAVAGVRLATTCAGIRKAGRRDLVLVELAAGTRAAAVFTRNAFQAAPVQVARRHLAACGGEPRYLLVNTGNANAGTGAAGIEAAERCCAAVAGLCAVDTTRVLPFSTGVIGEPLPVVAIENALPNLPGALSAHGWSEAAVGIMTTDTRPKLASRRVDTPAGPITVTGMAKGAGMLRPDMATMLAYLATDARVPSALLDSLLRRAVDLSFHRISVDGDTSTNDACVLLATGASGVDITAPASPEAVALAEAIEGVAVELAQALVRDGEGASKFVSVMVEGGRSEDECLAVAFTIAHSPLVKTALFASDPNWGRLLAAIGRAGLAELDVDLITLHLNGTLIAERGCREASYREELGAAAMAPASIDIRVGLGRGEASTTVWTSDFSYDYVRINAEYRT